MNINFYIVIDLTKSGIEPRCITAVADAICSQPVSVKFMCVFVTGFG